MTAWKKALAALLTLALLGALGWAVYDKIRTRGQGDDAGGPGGAGRGRGGPVAVEVAPVQRGRIVQQGVFTGTLRPRAQFNVAAKVAGRVEQLLVDVGDTVPRGAAVAKLDDAEFEQAVAQAQAALVVSQAQSEQATNAVKIARREFERVQTLQQRGIASESELDQARSSLEAAEAQMQVAAAQVQREQAALAAAQIRRSYTDVRANWENGDEARVVGERYINEGDTVNANDPLVSVLSIRELYAQVFVAERDYGRLSVGQTATLSTDAFAGRSFEAKVARLSPQFQTESRQALVELRVSNPEALLKPGMFVRIEVELARADDAVLVPLAALVRRQEQQGLFVVSDDGKQVRYVPVQVGIVGRQQAQVIGQGVEGRVVTLGQQLLRDGSSIVIPAAQAGGDSATGAQPSPERRP